MSSEGPVISSQGLNSRSLACRFRASALFRVSVCLATGKFQLVACFCKLCPSLFAVSLLWSGQIPGAWCVHSMTYVSLEKNREDLWTVSEQILLPSQGRSARSSFKGIKENDVRWGLKKKLFASRARPVLSRTRTAQHGFIRAARELSSHDSHPPSTSVVSQVILPFRTAVQNFNDGCNAALSRHTTVFKVFRFWQCGWVQFYFSSLSEQARVSKVTFHHICLWAQLFTKFCNQKLQRIHNFDISVVAGTTFFSEILSHRWWFVVLPDVCLLTPERKKSWQNSMQSQMVDDKVRLCL